MTGKIEGWLPGARGRRVGELGFNGCRVSVWNDGRVLEMDGGDGCTAMNVLNATELFI